MAHNTRKADAIRHARQAAYWRQQAALTEGCAARAVCHAKAQKHEASALALAGYQGGA